MNRSAGLVVVVAAINVLAACPAHAQTDLQLWGNVTLDWGKSERLVYELDVEPKGLLHAPEGEPDWRNVDLTPNVEYSPRSWLVAASPGGSRLSTSGRDRETPSRKTSQPLTTSSTCA